MATGEESTRNETADIKLNRAPFSLRCGDEAHPHDVLIPPWRNQPHSANCAPSCWRTAHIIRFVPPHDSRRSPFICPQEQDFSHHAFVSSVASASYTERRSHVEMPVSCARVRGRSIHGIFGCPQQSSVLFVFRAGNCAWLCARRAGPPPVYRSRM